MAFEWSRVVASASTLHTSIRFDLLAEQTIRMEKPQSMCTSRGSSHIRKDEAPLPVLRQLDAEGMADAGGLVDGREVGHGDGLSGIEARKHGLGAPGSWARSWALAMCVTLGRRGDVSPELRLLSRDGSRWWTRPRGGRGRSALSNDAITGISAKRVLHFSIHLQPTTPRSTPVRQLMD